MQALLKLCKEYHKNVLINLVCMLHYIIKEKYLFEYKNSDSECMASFKLSEVWCDDMKSL
jgi:hypothetical protein